MNNMPVVISINKPRRVERAFHRMSHQIRYSRKEERTELMHMLADAGLQDRVVKHMFFGVSAPPPLPESHPILPSVISSR